MSYPTYIGNGGKSFAGASVTPALPSGRQSGDLMILFFGGRFGSTSPSQSWSSDPTWIFQTGIGNAGSTSYMGGVFTRIVDGTEAAPTINVGAYNVGAAIFLFRGVGSIGTVFKQVEDTVFSVSLGPTPSTSDFSKFVAFVSSDTKGGWGTSSTGFTNEYSSGSGTNADIGFADKNVPTMGTNVSQSAPLQVAGGAPRVYAVMFELKEVETNSAALEAASSDLLAAEAASSDLALKGDAASSDLAAQQEIASDIHLQVEAASSDRILAEEVSSDEAASSNLALKEAASSGQAIIVEGASSDLAIIREQQSDGRLLAEAASSDFELAHRPFQEAASSDLQDTIARGPYFFAWADDGEAFNELIHARFDDDIFEYTLEQQEGDFASLSLTIKNPRIGLLAPGRQIWAWFSWTDGTQIIPLFYGRLIGLPENLADETVVLNFIARPSDFAAQKTAYAETLKIRPYWEPIWFSADTRDDPDNVLEFRPEVWHIDRTTLTVTASDITDGEDGTISFDETQVFYDSVKVSYSQNPLHTVQMTATVSWMQAGTGTATPTRGAGFQSGSQIMSYTGAGLAQGWPRTGDSIGGGWTFSSASAVATGMVDSSLVGEIAFDRLGHSFYVDGGFDTSLGTWGIEPTGHNIGWSYHVAIPNVTVTWNLALAWAANRQKTEVLTFTLNADVQSIVTLPDDGEVLSLTMQSSEVTNGVDAGGAIPVGTPLARGYFNTDRGAQSIESLIAIARTHLLARARCVNVTFEIPFELAISSVVTLRKNATITDPRLPGGAAGGKITHYVFSMTDGRQIASLTIGCLIGKEGTHNEIVGTPDYVDDGYVEDGYQTRSGAFSLPFASDIAYESQTNVTPNDDGLDFTRNLAGAGITVDILNGNGAGETQADALGRFTINVSNTGQVDAKNTRYAQLKVTVPDLTGGPFQTDYAVNITDLKIPKTIDLEAASEGASS